MQQVPHSIPASQSAMPFDDFRALVRQLPSGDERAVAVVRQRNEVLSKPVGSAGRLELIAEWLAMWSGKSPKVQRPLVTVFAGTHSASVQGDTVSANQTLVDVTLATAGGAAVNQACAVNDVGLKIFDLALQYPVADITRQAALDERGCAATIAFGMEALAGGSDLIAIGDMGAGNDIASAAMLAAIHGGPAEHFIATRAGENAEQFSRRVGLVEQALQTHKGQLRDPLEVLRRLGGREHAAIFGAILAARVQHVPVILDGLAAIAAASILAAMDADAIGHCTIADLGTSGENGQSALNRAAEKLSALKAGPFAITNFGIGLSDGTAGAIAAGICRTAAQIHSGMATSDD